MSFVKADLHVLSLERREKAGENPRQIKITSLFTTYFSILCPETLGRLSELH